MDNKENVIHGLKCIVGEITLPDCSNCKYCDMVEDFYDCVKVIVADALRLLKEQDTIIESLTKEKEELLLERIAELQRNIDALHTSMQGTILVNNAIEQRKGGELGWLTGKKQ